jgi:transcriptional regulator with PAS, ATPase and Fis domain
MPLELQVQMLRVLENRTITRIGGVEELPVDVRVVAATNRWLRDAVAQGKLREDLLFRLMVFPIHMPPLRRRQGDVDLLAQRFLSALNKTHVAHKRFSEAALQQLRAYHWPGNVRELRNAVQHAFILADVDIGVEHLPTLNVPLTEETGSLRFTAGTRIEDFERRFILATLEHHGGDKRATAETLGVSLKTLYNRLNQYRDNDA